MEVVDGIYLLGGDLNGLNFEIEYLDAGGRYREAFYSICHVVAGNPMSWTFSGDRLELRFNSGGWRFVRLPGGIQKIIEVRRPAVLGGEMVFDNLSLYGDDPCLMK